MREEPVRAIELIPRPPGRKVHCFAAPSQVIGTVGNADKVPLLEKRLGLKPHQACG